MLSSALEADIDEVAIAADLRELAAALDRVGYGEILTSFLPQKAQAHVWAQTAAKLDGPLRTLMELFLLGRAVPLDDLPPRVAAVVPGLTEAGLMHTGQGGVWLPNLILLRPMGQWLWCQRPHPSPTMYFGDDSLALVHRMVTHRGGRALDLCAGPGVQALTASIRSARVTAVEINPVAAALCRTNIAMNDLQDRMEVRLGDLYHAVEGEVFDDIVSNPPLLPVPEEVQFAFVGDGGRDGFDISWTILNGLPEHLSDKGACRIVGCVLSDGYVPVVMDGLGEWAAKSDFDVLLSVTAHVEAHHGSSFLRSMSLMSSQISGRPAEELQDLYAQDYAELGGSHVAFYELCARRGGGKAQLLDVSATKRSAEVWFV
ncbi:methyltransferase [Lentzea sp. NEAU-D7]|uniref:methyltransferase n=1 Tax=Lentzea sp. NEAU-D7 TaxID=2994667 RepID=UPI00224AF2BB|nr:methyltransferase [Lentzea sp. NEAU-D7]MCX2951561.1 methyltransferase [Lentzea sp. NEAU-D7]